MIILEFGGFLFFEKSRPGCLSLAIVQWIGIFIINFKNHTNIFWVCFLERVSECIIFVYYRSVTNLKGHKQLFFILLIVWFGGSDSWTIIQFKKFDIDKNVNIQKLKNSYMYQFTKLIIYWFCFTLIVICIKQGAG